MSDASAARSTASRPTRSSTRSAGSGFASAPLAKTLRSSTLRLALICIATFGAAILGLFGYVYWSTATYVLSRQDASVAADFAGLSSTYERDGVSGIAASIVRRSTARHHVDSVYLLVDAAFMPIAGNLKAWPSELAGAAGWGNFTAPDWKPAAAARPTLRARFETLKGGEHLLVGTDISDLAMYARHIDMALAFGVALFFVLAGVAGISVTRRTVGRIEQVNALSLAIMQRGLSERIPLRGSRDEWDQLAANLNLMLDRIEALMAEVKQVSDNVAHDLRTPLTRMRGRLEKAADRPRLADEDQALINDTMADLDGVLRMFASLTRISQIEASDRTAAFRSVNLAEIAREVVELFDAAAEDRGVRLTAAGDERVLVTGDRDLLFDATANLVDNAIKHGRAAGEVDVAVTDGATGAAITVTDDGPGIPEHALPHVFKRFYRLERSRRTPGNGLGLSLVAAVARLHGAHIEMRDNAPGLRFRVHFPLAADADGAAGEAAAAANAGSDSAQV
jgi:signal transduction histidine kinase